MDVKVPSVVPSAIDAFKKTKNLQQDLDEMSGGNPEEGTQWCIYSSNVTCSV